MFKLFQINFDNLEVAIINSRSDASVNAKYNLYLDTMSGGKVGAVWLAWKTDLYKLVAEIDAVDLDDVFEIGNIGPEEKIVRKAPMHSVSVGDVIQDKEGKLHIVQSFGFGELLAA